MSDDISVDDQEDLQDDDGALCQCGHGHEDHDQDVGCIGTIVTTLSRRVFCDCTTFRPIEVAR